MYEPQAYEVVKRFIDKKGWVVFISDCAQAELQELGMSGAVSAAKFTTLAVTVINHDKIIHHDDPSR